MEHETLAAWLQWLEQQHPKEIDLGLERVAEVAERLQLPLKLAHNSKIITVAGTNGKGSFVRTLEALLLNKGQTVAVYSSPHLLQFNERMQVNGEMVSDEQLMLAFQSVFDVLDAVSLSYFEFTTLAAFWLFAQEKVDYCLLEVGLGGRLDAVNILPPDWAIITSIALDHCDYLGHDLNSIAKEKCGILRTDTPLICAEVNKPEALQQACEKHRSYSLGEDFHVHIEQPSTGQWCFQQADFSSSLLPDNGLSLSSQAAAIQLYLLLLEESSLSFNTEEFNCLQSVSLPGRFQQFTVNDIHIVLDVAHNPQAVALLKARLQQQMPLAQGNKRIAVIAMLEDKDADSVIACLKEDIQAWFVADLAHERAFPASALAERVLQQGSHRISVNKNVRQAFARAQSLCQAGDQIVVLGSFFTVAQVLPRLQRQQKEVS